MVILNNHTQCQEPKVCEKQHQNYRRPVSPEAQQQNQNFMLDAMSRFLDSFF